MARRFVRIDLSDTARDYRPMAIEPGVALLDKSGGNAKILFKWLGGLVGEPEWDGESVGFYVRDEYGGRLEDVACSLVTDDDLKGPLKDDLEAIKQRLAKAKPETSTERAILKIVSAAFLDLAENPNRTDRDHYFFRYRDVQGRWRLVWCWGYQRVDQHPAATVVCTDPACRLLFVRRPGQSMKCPSCEAHVAHRPAPPRWRKRGVLVGLLLVLLAGVLLWWLLAPGRNGPVEPGGMVAGPVAPVAGDEAASRPEVRITSDQGPAVQFPVGAEFDDFRVEVHYPDGMTRIVTKKAAFSTPETADKALVGFLGGRLVGVRPGQTTVSAEYEGVAAKTPLEVRVTAEVDADQIRLAPASAQILPGETMALEATGHKNQKSIGRLTRVGGLRWSADNPRVLSVNGPSVTGVQVGKGRVTARIGALASDPAEVSVVESIADGLVVQGADRKKLSVLEMRVGQALRVGDDVAVLRAGVDLSHEAEVAPARSDIVRYDAQTRTLHGVGPGETPVRFAVGDKVAAAVARVLAPRPLEGQLVIEPASGVFSPGQAIRLRLFLIDKQGERIDVTDSATFSSSAPETVEMRANQACALAPGTAEITATAPEAGAARAALTVDNEEIAELIPEPARVRVSVGDIAPLRVAGRSASGTRELFAQPTLKLSVAGQNPQAIRLVGPSAVEALAAGSAEVRVDWQGRLQQQVPVVVTDDVLAELRLEPAEATIHPGQGLVYQVTGMRGGRRRVLAQEDGVKLSTADPAVAHVVGAFGVEARNLGRTDVVAEAAGQQAKASLNVVAGAGAPVVVTDYPHGVVITGPGGGWFDAGGGYHVWREGIGGRVVGAGAGVIGAGAGPAGAAAELLQPSDTVWIEPRRASVKVGETTPPFALMVRGADGTQRVLSAIPQSMDETILVPETQEGGRFLARSLGRTQVRARHGDREAFADVSVIGERFAAVKTSISQQSDKDFTVAVDIVAADPDAPLEYRAYAADGEPPAAWVPSQRQGGSRRVLLESPRIATGPPSAFYRLVFEARDPTDGSIQKYPYAFRLGRTIEEVTEAPEPPPPRPTPETPPANPFDVPPETPPGRPAEGPAAGGAPPGGGQARTSTPR